MKRLFKKSLLVSLLLVGQGFFQSAVGQEPAKPSLEARFRQDTNQVEPSYQENLSSLVSYMKGKGFDIDSLIADERFKIDDSIVIRFKNSSEKRAKDLDEYKRIHEYEKKKIAILEFMEKNLSQLRRAEETYGIPKETIAAIFGIESNFARGSGRFNPFNAYVSMHVKGIRSDLAIPQLIELLKFCRKNSINVFDLKSSYAGAMSYAQFIPSSLNNWFVGADLYNLDNNIMSVANYLSHFKKRSGSLEQAVYGYNHKDFYVRFVMDLAKEAEKALAGPQQKQF